MRTMTWSGSLALGLGMAAACGGGDSVGPPKEQIVGSWAATKVEYVSTTGLGTVELIGAGGTATLVLNADNTWVFTYTPPGGTSEVQTGTYELNGDLMKVTPTGASWYCL